MDYPTFLLALLHVYRALCEKVLWHTSVPFAENMSLECVYPSMGVVAQVEWFKIGTKKDSIAIYSPTHGVVIRKPYAEKVYFLNSVMASNNMTLFFRNASEDDVGYYSCSLYTYPEGAWQKVIQVVQSEMMYPIPQFLDSSPVPVGFHGADSFETAVPPNSHIVSEPGKNITLTCQPQMTWPVQEVRWEKIQPHQIDLLTYCNLVHGRNFTSSFPRQIVNNCSHGVESFIIIPDARASDSGLYSCRFQASTGENETFVMRLTVAEGPSNHCSIPCFCKFKFFRFHIQVKPITNIFPMWLEGQFYCCYLLSQLPPSLSFALTEGEGEREEIYLQSPGIQRRRHPATLQLPSLPVNLPVNPWMMQERIFMSTTQPSLVDQRLEFKLILDMSALITTLTYSCMDLYAISFHNPGSTLDTS
nr:CD226 antigen isoform X1 [Aotus nancymaae]XP_012320814.1 CD226 antigen isoform X1 [Aotus nancymaae]